jgi:methyl-accepting chemotaxis protein
VNPLTLPPRLVLRALSDLHQIARVAGDAPRLEAEMGGRIDELDGHLARLLEAVDPLSATLRTAPSLDGSDGGLDLRRVGTDLTAVADAARTLPDVEDRLTRRISSLESSLAGLVEIVSRLEENLPGLRRIINAVEQLDGKLEGVIVRVDRIEQQLPAIEEVLQAVHELGGSAGQLASAAEPLQGTAERIGRIVDRLPGMG